MMKKIVFGVALAVCCAACSEDPVSTPFGGNGSGTSGNGGVSEPTTGTMTFTNRSHYNTYNVRFGDGTAFDLAKGSTRSGRLQAGSYVVTATQKTGHVGGHAATYSKTLYLRAGGANKFVFPDLGSIVITNASSSTFAAQINGGGVYYLLGGESITLKSMDAGYYSVYCVQQNGYWFYPTTKTLVGTLVGGKTITFKITN